MALLKILVFAAVPVVVGVYVFWFMSDDITPPEMVDKWWGKTQKTAVKEDTAIRPFLINATGSELKDLQDRLKNVRLPTSLEDTQFEYGFHSNYLKDVLEYWRTKYDWSKYQAQLNSLPQFKTKINGIDVHFLRILPSGNVGKKRAIMMIHGWPGSVWELYKVIPLLTGSKTGKKDDDGTALEVICPSIPGYGFSEAPHKPGFTGVEAAQIFYKLMLRLGHEKFYVHGGDYGALISTIMGKAYPNNVIGVHVNWAPFPLVHWGTVLKLFVGEIFPSLIYTPLEREIKIPLKVLLINSLKEFGYLHIQATKPDTVAVGLNDSPAGLAAYILEKFSSWSNMKYRNCSDGCITKHFTLDELLTNVMIYWLSGSIGSSVRLYKEHFGSSRALLWDRFPVTIPSGIAAFPHELIHHARALVALGFHNIVQYTNMPRGGHFAAFEEPQLMADDIRSFVKTVEQLVSSSHQ